MTRVLILEDDESLAQTLRSTLVKAGYEPIVVCGGQVGLDVIRAQPPDFALVDLDLVAPRLNGLDVCRTIRADTTDTAIRRIPIIVLSGSGEEIDKVVALEVGADDYVTKPIGMHELLARMKAVLRRVNESAPVPVEPPFLEAGDLVVDLVKRQARLGEKEIHLKPRELEVLVYLLRHPGQVVTRDRLLNSIWGSAHEGGRRYRPMHNQFRA